MDITSHVLNFVRSSDLHRFRTVLRPSIGSTGGSGLTLIPSVRKKHSRHPKLYALRFVCFKLAPKYEYTSIRFSALRFTPRPNSVITAVLAVSPIRITRSVVSSFNAVSCIPSLIFSRSVTVLSTMESVLPLWPVSVQEEQLATLTVWIHKSRKGINYSSQSISEDHSLPLSDAKLHRV